MNIITFRLTDIIEKFTVVDLSKDSLNWKRIIIFGGIFGLFSIIMLLLLISFGVELLYRQIILISLLAVTLIGMIISGYELLNTLYQQPILILTTSNIYLGLKALFRPAIITDKGIIPREDLQLVIVKDSRSQRFRLFLEGRKILQLGVFNTINEAELQRMHLKNLLSDFYHQIYISSPKYHEI